MKCFIFDHGCENLSLYNIKCLPLISCNSVILYRRQLNYAYKWSNIVTIPEYLLFLGSYTERLKSENLNVSF